MLHFPISIRSKIMGSNTFEIPSISVTFNHRHLQREHKILKYTKTNTTKSINICKINCLLHFSTVRFNISQFYISQKIGTKSMVVNRYIYIYI